MAETPRLSLQAAVADRANCIVCHDTFDPAGFALEAFDAEARLTGFPTHGALRASESGPAVAVSGPVALGEEATRSPAARACLHRRGVEYVAQREITSKFIALSSEPPFGERAQAIAREDPETEWLRCLASALGAEEPSVTALMEALVVSDLLVTRDDQPRRVVALDTSADPVQHALQETLQLQGAYGEEDSLVLVRYAQALIEAQASAPPLGGAGAGGDSGAAGSSGEGGGEGGAAGAP